MHEILQVIYTPQKAFKEIQKNPKYIGPLLIMSLFVVAQTAFFYTIMSRSFVEKTLPNIEQLDIWTENATLWEKSPGLTISNNYNDYINGIYYGNSSIEFSSVNETKISIKLNDIGPVDCYGPDGYKNLSLRIKMIDPSVKPENATIYLFSTTPLNYFLYTLTDFFNSPINVWNNITIPVGSEEWLGNSVASNWENISSLKLEFTWASKEDITLRADGFFFRGIFTNVANVDDLSFLLSFSLLALAQFCFQWILLTGLLYLMTKGLGAQIVWMTLMVSVGFALITMVIQAVVNVATHLTLPKIYYTFEVMGGVSGESDIALNNILEITSFVSQASIYLQVIVYVWIIILCGIATRLLTKFAWVKSFLISTSAFLITIIVLGSLFGL